MQTPDTPLHSSDLRQAALRIRMLDFVGSPHEANVTINSTRELMPKSSRATPDPSLPTSKITATPSTPSATLLKSYTSTLLLLTAAQRFEQAREATRKLSESSRNPSPPFKDSQTACHSAKSDAAEPAESAPPGPSVEPTQLQQQPQEQLLEPSRETPLEAKELDAASGIVLSPESATKLSADPHTEALRRQEESLSSLEEALDSGAALSPAQAARLKELAKRARASCNDDQTEKTSEMEPPDPSAAALKSSVGDGQLMLSEVSEAQPEPKEAVSIPFSPAESLPLPDEAGVVPESSSKKSFRKMSALARMAARIYGKSRTFFASDDATAPLKLAAERQKDSAVIWLDKGILHLELGEVMEADVCLKTAKRLHEENSAFARKDRWKLRQNLEILLLARRVHTHRERAEPVLDTAGNDAASTYYDAHADEHEDVQAASGLCAFAASTGIPEGTAALLGRRVEIRRNCLEILRDAVLQSLSTPVSVAVLTACSLAVLMLVIGWGIIAVYTALGLYAPFDNGWNDYSQRCIQFAAQQNELLSPRYTPVTSGSSHVDPCTSNQLYFNMSSKILVVCFTFINILPLPWSLAALHHSCCSRRFKAPLVVIEAQEVIGFDFYGRRTKSMWFCLSRSRQRAIASLLVIAGGLQTACLVMHIYYPSHVEGRTLPGVVFQSSFLLGALISQVMARCLNRTGEAQVRRLAPTSYPRSTMRIIMDAVGHWCDEGSTPTTISDSSPLTSLKMILAEIQKEEKKFGKQSRPLTAVDVNSIHRPKMGMALPASVSWHARIASPTNQQLADIGKRSKNCVEVLRDVVLRVLAHPWIEISTLLASLPICIGTLGWLCMLAWTSLGIYAPFDNGWNDYSQRCIQLAAQQNAPLTPLFIQKPLGAQWGWSRSAQVEHCTSNQLYFDVSGKVLIACFSYINLLPLPWSFALLHQCWCSHRSKSPQRRDGKVIGFDFYGTEVVDSARNRAIWFCLPSCQRKLIALLLTMTWSFHAAGLSLHFIYPSYIERNPWPAFLYQNVLPCIFFVVSIASHLCATIIQTSAENTLRHGRRQQSRGAPAPLSPSPMIINPSVETTPLNQQIAIFGEGFLGLGLKNRLHDRKVVISSVDVGSQAAAQGVIVGSIVHAVNDKTVGGLHKNEILALIRDARRPLTLTTAIKVADVSAGAVSESATAEPPAAGPTAAQPAAPATTRSVRVSFVDM